MRMSMRDRGQGVRTRMQSTRFQVSAPYSVDFVTKAHDLGGRWKRRSQIWSFDRSKYFDVARVINSCYGTSLPVEPSDD